MQNPFKKPAVALMTVFALSAAPTTTQAQPNPLLDESHWAGVKQSMETAFDWTKKAAPWAGAGVVVLAGVGYALTRRKGPEKTPGV